MMGQNGVDREHAGVAEVFGIIEKAVQIGRIGRDVGARHAVPLQVPLDYDLAFDLLLRAENLADAVRGHIRRRLDG